MKPDSKKRQRKAKRLQEEFRQKKEVLELEMEIAVAKAEDAAYEQTEVQSQQPEESLHHVVDHEIGQMVKPSPREVQAWVDDRSSQMPTGPALSNDSFVRVDREVSFRKQSMQGYEEPIIHGIEPRPLSAERNLPPSIRNPQEERQHAVESQNTSSISSNQLEAILKQQCLLMGVMQAPKVSLMNFDGEPLRYHQFIRTFEENVEKVIPDNAARLTRLAQHCTGEAKRVVDCCLLMDPEMGYPRARKLLKERFGNRIAIATLWIQKLTEEEQRPLREYADNLRSCQEALNAMGALNELNTQGNLFKLVKKLPMYLQGRW